MFASPQVDEAWCKRGRKCKQSRCSTCQICKRCDCSCGHTRRNSAEELIAAEANIQSMRSKADVAAAELRERKKPLNQPSQQAEDRFESPGDSHATTEKLHNERLRVEKQHVARMTAEKEDLCVMLSRILQQGHVTYPLISALLQQFACCSPAKATFGEQASLSLLRKPAELVLITPLYPTTCALAPVLHFLRALLNFPVVTAAWCISRTFCEQQRTTQ